MQALAMSHKHVHRLTTHELLRTAYMHRFGKDITCLSLANDAKCFDERGTIPPYLTEYLIHVYGVQ